MMVRKAKIPPDLDLEDILDGFLALNEFKRSNEANEGNIGHVT